MKANISALDFLVKELFELRNPTLNQIQIIKNAQKIDDLIKIKIIKRLDNYKKERQIWIDKQKNYRWSKKEAEEGSELYGSYQEKEMIFNYKILELEWFLQIL